RIYQKDFSIFRLRGRLFIVSGIGIILIYLLNDLIIRSSLQLGVELAMARALALGTVSFLLAVIWGYPLITLLKRWGIGKQIRVELPGGHQMKTGTPTMGGILIVLPVLLITGVLNIANLLGMNLI